MPANVRRTSPIATGTVLRSTATRPRSRVDDDAGAVVIALRHAGHRIRHAEFDQHERRRQRVDQPVAGVRELVSCRAAAAAHPGRRHGLAGPQPDRVVAHAVACREPVAVDAQRRELQRAGLFHREVAHGHALAIAQRAEHGQRVGEVRHRLAVQLGQYRAARNASGAEHVARIRDIDPRDRHVHVPRHLPGQRVQDAVADLEVLVGRDLLQVLHRQPDCP